MEVADCKNAQYGKLQNIRHSACPWKWNGQSSNGKALFLQKLKQKQKLKNIQYREYRLLLVGFLTQL
jgi:hypothetical protein